MSTPDPEPWKPVNELPKLRNPTVVDFETAPLTAAVSERRIHTAESVSVTLDFRAPATDESPAVVRAVVANNEQFDQTVRSRRLVILADPPRGETEDGHVAYLAPTEGHPIAESVPEVNQDDEGRWRIEGVRGDWFPSTVTIPAESGFEAEYHFLGHHRLDESPIMPGYYEFRHQARFEIAVWPTEQPGPTVESRFAQTDPPSLREDGRMAWYHDASPATEIFLEPSTETISPPESVAFTLTNHSREGARGNPDYWRVYKLVDDEWFPILPWRWTMPEATVWPGARRQSVLAVFHGKPIQCKGTTEVSHLGGGTYAYEVDFRVADETHGAMFEVDAPPLEVGSETDITIKQDGATIEVRLPDYEQSQRIATVTVTRASVDDEIDRYLIPEQLSRRRYRVLRNALPLFEPDIEEIRVRTDREIAMSPFGFDGEKSLTIRYAETTFRVTIDIISEE